MCWAIWKSRNTVYFEKKPIKSPTETMCLASSLIMCWESLHKEAEKLDLEAGAEALKATALHFHPHRDPGADDDGPVLLH
jgi:hypothetical protein